jgi:GTPase SAR1 family protein
MIKEEDLNDLIYLQKQLNENNLVDCELGFSMTANLLNEKSHLDGTHKDKNFQRLMHLLIKYNLAKFVSAKNSNFFTITELTSCIKIEDIYADEKEIKRKGDIEFELKEASLKQTKWFLCTKWWPLAFTFIGLVIAAINLYFTTKNNGKVQNIDSRLILIEDLNKSKQDSTKNNQQTTLVKSPRDTQP